MNKPVNRWLKSRIMLICVGLCFMSYVPAVWEKLGGEFMSQWIGVFGGIATASVMVLGGKNAVDSWRNGPYVDPNEREAAMED